MSERTLHAKDFEHFGIVEFLGETNLLDTVSDELKSHLFLVHFSVLFSSKNE